MTSLSPFGRLSVTASPIRPSTASVWLPTLLILLGAVLRLDGLNRDMRFHIDESLYADHARRMILLGDRFLETTVNDKPPVTYYLVGNSFYFFGESEFAARLPNAAASLLNLALFYTLTYRLTRQRLTAILALFLLVISPLDIAYAPTVFQDPPMLTFALLAMSYSLCQRWGLAGFAIGISIITKPSGLWLLPLVIAVGLLPRHFIKPLTLYIFLQRAVVFSIALFIPIRFVIWWDDQSQPQSFIKLGAYNSNPARLIRGHEVWSRFHGWLEIFPHVTGGSTIIAVGFLIISVLWLGYAAYQRTLDGLGAELFALYLLIYLGIYWFFAFNVWNRYIYQLIPFMLVIPAQALTNIHQVFQRLTMPQIVKRRVLLSLCTIIFVIALPHTRQAPHLTEYPGLKGIDELADTLNRNFQGAVVYDHWLGWSLRWYLGKYPGVYLVYFPTPEDLALHLQQGDGAQYFIAPNPDAGYVWATILNSYDVQTIPICQTPHGDFVIYRVIPTNMVNAENLSTDFHEDFLKPQTLSHDCRP